MVDDRRSAPATRQPLRVGGGRRRSDQGAACSRHTSTSGDAASVKKLAQQPDDRLTELADRAFGTPPAIRHMDVLVDPLRNNWLESIDDGVSVELVSILQLGLTGAVANRRSGSRRERLDFVRAHRRTKNLLVNLRKAFIRAHRRPTPVRPAPPRDPVEAAKQAVRGAGLPDPREPHPHQLAAWAGLDRMARGSEPWRGVVALPHPIARWRHNRMADGGSADGAARAAVGGPRYAYRMLPSSVTL